MSERFDDGLVAEHDDLERRPYPAMRGELAVVRTTNGGEVTAYVWTDGTTYHVDAQHLSGHWFTVMGWRVLSVERLEGLAADVETEGRV